MTPKEIALSVLEGRKPDRLPVTLWGGGMWSIHNWGSTFEAISTDVDKMTQMIIDISEKLQCDIVYVGSGYNNFPTAALGGKIKFREGIAPDLEDPIIRSEEDLAKLNLEEIDKDETTNTIKEVLRRTKEKIGNQYLVTMTAWGPFTNAGRLYGEDAFMKATYKKPDFVNKILDFVTELLIHLYEPAVSDGTIEVIALADPTASGDVVSKKCFERFALPYLKKFTDWAKSKNVHTLLHICGDTTDRIELFPATGACCISVDHKTDLTKAKELLYGKMCFAGNVNPVEVMLQGSVEIVENTCKQIVETVGTNGAFILMPGCDIPPDVPYENIKKFIQVAQETKL